MIAVPWDAWVAITASMKGASCWPLASMAADKSGQAMGS